MSPLWLITTYFNPLGWRSRRENYHIFCRHLDARLLTVSWSPEGTHELEEGDADILIRVDGGDLMWQKERLINIGLAHLPGDCELVGWVDCDILFQDPLWQQKVIELLRDHQLVQLFSSVFFLGPEDSRKADPCPTSLRPPLRRPSLIQAWRHGADPDGFLEQELERRRRQCSGELRAQPPGEDCGIAPGLAWAAQRAWLVHIGGLPDRAVIGGGDLQAAYGFLNRLGDFNRMLRQHGLAHYIASHTLRWVDRVQRTAPLIGHVSGTLLHLHHGDLTQRYYARRQFDLMRTGFLPDQHLELDAGGAWRFNDAAPTAIREMMARYFASRREDGRDEASVPTRAISIP